MKHISILLALLTLLSCHSHKIVSQSDWPRIPFEEDNLSELGTTATFDEAIDFYKEMSTLSPLVSIYEGGSTDIGRPLHVVVVDKDGLTSPADIRDAGRGILFINNGIHAGEPCGIDASMILTRDLIADPSLRSYLSSVSIVIIPVYNIGSVLNRGAYSRANQNGPMEYGFRGNAQNLDLNRDFIKADSENARSFNRIFSQWSPDVFIDTHTSNGADYQYTMTLIAGQKEKMSKSVGMLMQQQILPDLYASMSLEGEEMTPYVFTRDTPDGGIYGFLDLPRFGSGYAALHHTIPFISEAHMLKPYRQRVSATHKLLLSLIKTQVKYKDLIIKTRQKSILETTQLDSLEIAWTLDESAVEEISFKGYEATYRPSEVSGMDRLYYDHDKPYQKNIPFYNTYKASIKVSIPHAYVVPQAYRHVIERLRDNEVVMQMLRQDTIISVSQYIIEDFKTSKSAYEKHYLHSNVEVKAIDRQSTYRKGDFVIYTNQPLIRYIVETLEPQGPDSYFAWNFFDGILMQKEHYSAYVFEDTAAKLLATDAGLKALFEAAKNLDPAFDSNPSAQLEFIYKNSPYYEQTYNLYPVGRINK